MKITSRFILSTLATSLALGVAIPASAAAWERPGALRSEIAQLDRQIDRAEARRIISQREAARLSGQVDRLESTFRSYARGGFTRFELASLDSRIEAVKRQLAVQARDDDRRGYDHRYDRGGQDRHRR